MSIVATSIGAILTGPRGPAAIQVGATPLVTAIGAGAVGLVGQFPWGPDAELTEVASIGEFYDIFAPQGSDRTATGVLAVIAAAWPRLFLVRALGSSAAKATATLESSAPADLLTVEALCKGTTGNSLSAVVSDATNGDATNFKLTVSLTGASGTTTDVFDNVLIAAGVVSVNGVAVSSDTFEDKLLIGALTWIANGRPVNATYTFSSGANGSVASTDYVGTAGAPDQGVSLFEAEPAIRAVVADDCGDSLRAAVNAGLLAHAILMGNRIACVNGNSGLTVANTRTAKAALTTTKNGHFAAPWAYVRDTVTQAERLVPPGVFAASLIAQWPASTAISNRSAEAATMLSKITRLESDMSSARAVNTSLGIATLIKRANGSFTFESDPTMYYSTDANAGDLKVVRVSIEMIVTFLAKFESFTDQPNTALNRAAIFGAWKAQLEAWKRASQQNGALFAFYIDDYVVENPETATTPSEIAAGLVKIPTTVRVGSASSHIVLQLQAGLNELSSS